jgi:putative ABC transport system permease protein
MRRDIDRELSFHLAERADALRAEGLSDAEAERRARLQFGSPLAHAERTRDVNVSSWIDAAARTLRHAARAVARTPGFTATVVITLAVGIGANTAVFSAIDAVLLRPLPFPDGDRLVRVREVRETETSIAPIRLEDWSQSAAFDALSGYYLEDVSDTTGDLPQRIRRAVVAPRFLEVLRAAPALGSGPTAAANRSSESTAVLISDRYWRTRLGGEPRVLGGTVRIEGRPYTIAGIMPASFVFPDRGVDVWWPYPAGGPSAQNTTDARQLQWYTGIGRLARGVTPEQARADLASIQARLGREHPDSDADVGVRVAPFKEAMVGGVRSSLWLLFGAVSMLLLIACSNIAALLLSRAARRQHEVAIRFSLGGSRTAVAFQLLTETALLAFAGAAGGLLVAAAASAGIRRFATALPRLEEIAIDGRILAYTTTSAIVVALLCGVFPAVRSTRAPLTLARGGRSQAPGRHAVQWLLVGVQMTLSVALLGGAGLLLRSVDALSRVDPGFEPARVLAFRLSGNWTEEVDRRRLVQRIDGAIGELTALPGVASVATAWSLPGVPRRYQVEFHPVEGRSESEPPLMAEWRTVSHGYFGTLRVPLAAGALCREAATPDRTELMVNRSFADRYFRGRSVVGRRLQWEAATQTGAIAGVVANARELGLDRDVAPTVYVCDSAPNPFPWFLVRTHAGPLTVAAAVRARFKEFEPLRSVYDLAPLEDRIGDAYAQHRARTVFLALFAGTALAVACLGVYATLNYAVGLRRREVGLRLALGARRREVIRQLVGQAMRAVVPACILGLALSVVFARILSGLLFGVSPSDPLTLASVLGIALAVGLLGALVPAVRASTIEPMRVLRDE